MSAGYKQIIVVGTTSACERARWWPKVQPSIMFLVHRLCDADARETDHAIQEWLNQGMTKICVRVDSEAELLETAQKGEVAGLTLHVITDAGHTEFGGIPTRICLAIGPDEDEKIDTITGHLKLL